MYFFYLRFIPKGDHLQIVAPLLLDKKILCTYSSARRNMYVLATYVGFLRTSHVARARADDDARRHARAGRGVLVVPRRACLVKERT